MQSTNARTCPVYEHTAGTEIAFSGIRPGGLDLTRRALAWCRFPPGATILDVGCGTGITVEHLIAGHKLRGIGIDASPVLLKLGRDRNPAGPVVRGAGENLPFPDEYADGILAECSLSVMADPAAALDEFRRVLKNDGTLVLSDVYVRNPGFAQSSAPIQAKCCLNGAATREALTDRLAGRGFAIRLWEDHSERLKDFAVQLILAYGSLNEFWKQTIPALAHPGDIQRSISRMQPGYFLLIAQKSGGSNVMEGSR
ncbi:MAG: class I SAM-dependent methyltransferase [Pseudomonadota bacterium]